MTAPPDEPWADPTPGPYEPPYPGGSPVEPYDGPPGATRAPQGPPVPQYGPPPHAPLPLPPAQHYPPPVLHYAGSYPAPPAPSNGLGTSSMVLGILAVCLSWVPFVNFVLAVLALALGGTGWAKANRTGIGKGQSITGVVCGALVIAVGIVLIIAIGASIGSAGSA